MSSHADSHSKRRTLSIKLARPKPSLSATSFKISLKRPPSQSFVDLTRTLSDQDSDDDDDEDGEGSDKDEESQVDNQEGGETGNIDDSDSDGDDEPRFDRINSPSDSGIEKDQDSASDSLGQGSHHIGQRIQHPQDSDSQDSNDDGDSDQDEQEPDERQEAEQTRRLYSDKQLVSHPDDSLDFANRPIKRLRSKGLYDALPKLIDNLKRRDSYKFFWQPVDLDQVPNYLDYIKHPMDLGTMQIKVDQRDYSHINEFQRDFTLVVRNAQTFNPPGTLYHNEGRRLQVWGTKAIEREGLSINDNGRAGIKGEMLRDKSTIQHQHGKPVPETSKSVDKHLRKQPRLSVGGNVGLETLIDAARLKPKDKERAAVILALAQGRPLSAALLQESSEFDIKRESDDSDDSMSQDLDPTISLRRRPRRRQDSRDRSTTTDPGSELGQYGSLPTGVSCPSTPGPLGESGRHASPDALRKRLALVTGTPLTISANSPAGGVRLTLTQKQKQKLRLGPTGTPKRLNATRSLGGSATPSDLYTSLPTSTSTATANTSINTIPCQTMPNSYDADGSIDPEEIEDLYSFLALRCSSRPLLMPVIESLYPIAFIPQKHQLKSASNVEGKDKDKGKEQEDDKDGDKDRDKSDKDPLSSLPPLRIGAPDPLFLAIAPEPETVSSNYSHEIHTLPSTLQSMPFLLPSGHPQTSVVVRTKRNLNAKQAVIAEPPTKKPKLPVAWANHAYLEAIQNETRPKKQKDKEREKERETLEDWTHLRPRMSRLLEITDLGLYSTMIPGQTAGPMSPWDLLDADNSCLADAICNDLDSVQTDQRSSHVYDTLREAAVSQNQALNGLQLQELANSSSDIVRDMVFGGQLGEAYTRSVAEFVGGAITSPFLYDSDVEDDADLQEQKHELKPTWPSEDVVPFKQEPPFAPPFKTEGEDDVVDTPPMTEATLPSISPDIKLKQIDEADELSPLLLDRPLLQYVEDQVIRPLSGGMLDVLHLVAKYLGISGSKDENVEEIEKRLLHTKLLAYRRKQQQQQQQVSGSSSHEPERPFADLGELGWLQNQPQLANLLDEANENQNGLGLIIHHLIKTA